jgi:HD-GYP domain-containing protein (c-di-GMP phosphodiesterase class II)
MAALCQAVETNDLYTRGHSERVSRGAVMIGREIGMRASHMEAILHTRDAARCRQARDAHHRAGKCAPLTGEKFAAIQLHRMRGLHIVQEIGFLDQALAGIMHRTRPRLPEQLQRRISAAQQRHHPPSSSPPQARARNPLR